MISGIYKIKNCVTDMVYIGSAINFSKHWKNHKVELNLNRHCNPYLQSAWNKYNFVNFEFSVIEYCEPEKLLEREQYWIDKYQSCNRILGYNLQPVAGSMLGFKASEETKTLLSKLRKGKPRSEETKAKIKATMKGHQFSPETREKMRQAQLGKKHTEETKIKMGLSRLGNNNASGPMSEEHKQAISKSKIGHKHSKETISKIIASNIGKKRSIETRTKMSAAAIARHSKNTVDMPT